MPGLHFKLPLADQVMKVSVEEHGLRLPFGRPSRTEDPVNSPQSGPMEEETLMLTGDLNTASVEWTVQWKVSDPAQFLFRVVIDIPPETPSFESYEKWLEFNPVWLEKKGVRLAGVTMVERGRPPRAVVRYLFRQKGNRTAPLGRLSDWTLHFRTPERVIAVRVPYEFKNVPLP